MQADKSRSRSEAVGGCVGLLRREQGSARQAGVPCGLARSESAKFSSLSTEWAGNRAYRHCSPEAAGIRSAVRRYHQFTRPARRGRWRSSRREKERDLGLPEPEFIHKFVGPEFTNACCAAWFAENCANKRCTGGVLTHAFDRDLPGIVPVRRFCLTSSIHCQNPPAN